MAASGLAVLTSSYHENQNTVKNLPWRMIALELPFADTLQKITVLRVRVRQKWTPTTREWHREQFRWHLMLRWGWIP